MNPSQFNTKTMKNQTRHHRLPTSRGGTNDPKNISFVSEKEHRAYHYLFINMTPDELSKEFNDKYAHTDWNTLPYKTKEALHNLFGNKGIKEIVKDLNERWIDPNQTMRIVRKPFIQLQWEA